MPDPTALLRNVAKRLHRASGGRVPVEDLLQEGRIGAWLSSRKPAPAADRDRFAFVEGRSAMIDALRRETRGRAHAWADALEDDYELAGPDCTEASVYAVQQRKMLAEEIDRLRDPQRRVMIDFLAGRQQQDTAAALGVSPSAVSQMIARVTRQLARSVALRHADAQMLAAQASDSEIQPVDASLADVPGLADLFAADIVRGAGPRLLR